MLTQPFFSPFTLIVRGAIAVFVVDKNILLTVVLLILLLQLMSTSGRFFHTFGNIRVVCIQFFSWLHLLQFTRCPSNFARVSYVFEQRTRLRSNLVCEVSDMRCVATITWKENAIRFLVHSNISAIEHQLWLSGNRPSLNVLLVLQLYSANKAIFIWRDFDITAHMSYIWSRI